MSEEFKIRDMVVIDEDRQKTVTINNEKFVINAPTPKERKQIARHIVIQQNGMPVNSFNSFDLDMFTRDAWLTVLLVSYPKWWTNPDDCIDEGLKDQLYKELLEWDSEFQEKLKKNQFAKRGAES